MRNGLCNENNTFYAITFAPYINCSMQQLTVTGYSTALFATWYLVEELGILFDAGDGVTAGLLQKSGKVRSVFISHADRDHVTGLLQFNQLNAREGGPVIYYPADSGSFPALQEFSRRFDPHVHATRWQPVTPADEINIKDDVIVKAIRNSHVPAADNISKSQGYAVYQVKRKLRPELAGLPGEEIRKLSEANGKDSVTIETRENIISYSGDTPVEDMERWKDTNILIHEATFLNLKHDDHLMPNENKHSLLEEVIDMVSNTRVKQLILGHFSTRYTADEIERAVKQLCDKYALNVPVYCVLPGEVKRDILQSNPVNI